MCTCIYNDIKSIALSMANVFFEVFTKLNSRTKNILVQPEVHSKQDGNITNTVFSENLKQQPCFNSLYEIISNSLKQNENCYIKLIAQYQEKQTTVLFVTLKEWSSPKQIELNVLIEENIKLPKCPNYRSCYLPFTNCLQCIFTQS